MHSVLAPQYRRLLGNALQICLNKLRTTKLVKIKPAQSLPLILDSYCDPSGQAMHSRCTLSIQCQKWHTGSPHTKPDSGRQDCRLLKLYLHNAAQGCYQKMSICQRPPGPSSDVSLVCFWRFKLAYNTLAGFSWPKFEGTLGVPILLPVLGSYDAHGQWHVISGQHLGHAMGTAS